MSTLKTVNPDGTGARTLASRNGTAAPQWSPDGRRIAFQRADTSNGVPHIYVVNADGTGLKNLSGASAGTESGPSWSPRGTKIVFTRPNGISVMNADGTNKRYLTSNLYDYSPRWSPDGTTIAFTRHTCAARCAYQVFTMTAAGGHVTNLSRTNVAGVTRTDDVATDWSPDATKILFVRRYGFPYKYQIMTMNRDGTHVTRIAPSVTTIPRAPAWSPDGTKIAFADDRYVYTMPSKGGAAKQVTAGGQPAWGRRPT